MKPAILLFLVFASFLTNTAYGIMLQFRSTHQCDYADKSLEACLVEANKQFVADLPTSQLKFVVAIDQSIYGTAGLSAGHYLIETTAIMNTRIAPKSVTSIDFSVATTDVDCGGGPCGSLVTQTEALLDTQFAANAACESDLRSSNTNYVPFDAEWRVEIANTLWFAIGLTPSVFPCK